MVEHVSPEGFLGGLIFGALVAWLAAYLVWGKGRNATKVQLLAAQANEAAGQASERATLIEAAQDRAEYERKLAATRTAAEKEREQDRAEYEQELAATRTAAEKDRDQDRAEYEQALAATRTAAEKDRAEYEKGLYTAREGYHRARAEATWRSLSVGRTDWHDSLPSLTDGRLARNMD
jgi:hypothetical protein